jgi:KDO2-lipid IV(A) lauroyltransferase
VARLLPRSAGYALARFLAARIASQKNQPMVKAVRANQWVVRDGKLSAKELDDAVRSTFQDRAYSIVDLYHNLQKPEQMLKAVEFGPNFRDLVDRSQSRNQGLMVVLAHVSNYELAGLAAAKSGGQAVALTLPEQPGGYKQHDNIRRTFGIEAVPASMASLKYAARVLREGGIVATGTDRPLPGSSYRPKFFGRPAALPVHYTVLALRERVPVVVGCVYRQGEGKYQVVSSDVVPMKEYSSRKASILANSEKILEIVEDYIRQEPEQWAMFFPVWPEVVPEPSDI